MDEISVHDLMLRADLQGEPRRWRRAIDNEVNPWISLNAKIYVEQGDEFYVVYDDGRKEQWKVVKW